MTNNIANNLAAALRGALRFIDSFHRGDFGAHEYASVALAADHQRAGNASLAEYEAAQHVHADSPAGGVLDLLRKEAEHHERRAQSDAYSAAEAPKWEAAVDAFAKLVETARMAQATMADHEQSALKNRDAIKATYYGKKRECLDVALVGVAPMNGQEGANEPEGMRP